MEIRIAGHKMDVTQGMKEHIREKLVKLEKYAPRLVEAHVILKKQKYIFQAEITVLAKDLKAFGQGQSAENVFAAVDQAAIRVEKQLKKYREKRKDHHKGSGKKAAAVLAEGPRKTSAVKSPRIILDEEGLTKPMPLDEASMQLGIARESFLVFRNAGTKKINVIYKRKDGHHGLVEAE